MMRALVAEFGKLKRSRMLLWTALVVVGYTAMGLVMFPILRDWEVLAEASKLAGPVGEAYARSGITEVNWENSMRFIAMGVSGAWGTLLLSLIAAYVFGRELREGTDVAAATLPVRREAFVVAKLAVVAVWAIALAVLAVVIDIVVVAINLGFDGFAWSYVWTSLGETLYATLPLYLTVPVVAWLSLTRKGYFRPMLFALVMFMVANSLISTDAAAYFPWSMPIAAVGVTWMPVAGELTAVSWAIAGAVFGIGLIATLRRVNRAEQPA